ncbi:MAG: hypothetical protein H0U73_07295 [Tatlockia sp.]|nr:hypothetical protein [Tatlockia sp.]
MKKWLLLGLGLIGFFAGSALADPTQNPIAPQPSPIVNPNNSNPTQINYHFNNDQGYDLNTHINNWSDKKTGNIKNSSKHKPHTPPILPGEGNHGNMANPTSIK